MLLKFRLKETRDSYPRSYAMPAMGQWFDFPQELIALPARYDTHLIPYGRSCAEIFEIGWINNDDRTQAKRQRAAF